MTTKGQYLVPLGPDGSVLHYGDAPYVWVEDALVPVSGWRENEPFQARITISSVQSGRSAKYFIWRDAEGRTYPMFAVEMLDVLRHATIEDGGMVHGLWTVRKRGSNYGIEYQEGV